MNGKSVLGWGLGLLVLAIVVLVVLLQGWRMLERSLNEQRTEARWQEFWKAAVIAGTRLVDHPQRQAMDYDAEASRLVAIYDSRAQTFENPELTTAWSAIETQSATGMEILNRIGVIDQTKPSGWVILAHELQQDQAANQQGANEIIQRISNEIDIASLEGDFRQNERNLDNSIAGLDAVGEGLSHDDLGSVLSVDYYPAWDGVYWGDALSVQNTSGNTVENAVLVAAVHMSDGTSRTHLHYVDQWPSGATLQALYPYQPTDYANSQTANHPDNVSVEMFVRNGIARSGFALDDDAWAQKVRGYCSGVNFGNSKYLGPYTDSSGSYDAGFQLQFQGLSLLPLTSVEVKFDQGTATERDAVWTPSFRLVSGQSDNSQRTSALDGATPGHIDLILHFAETSWTDQVHIY
jgi:hypothetical protein